MVPVTVITGAAGGIGAAVAAATLTAGHRVALVDLAADALEKTAADLPGECLLLPADVGEPLEDLFATVRNTCGPLTHVVGAAGVLSTSPLATTSDDAWQRHLRVNATGTFHLLRASAAELTRGGSIVVIGSNAARVPRTDLAGYAASKAAAAAVTRVAALELAEREIRCNVVEPGSTDTAMQRDVWPDPVAGARAAVAGDPAHFRIGIPLGRIADPADIAGVVMFLLSDAARHVTMQQLFVDGGASL